MRTSGGGYQWFRTPPDEGGRGGPKRTYFCGRPLWMAPYLTLILIRTALQPHKCNSQLQEASYAAFIYGTSKRWTFVSRTTPNISENMKQLDWIIQETFLPAILGKDHVTDETKKVAALLTGDARLEFLALRLKCVSIERAGQ